MGFLLQLFTGVIAPWPARGEAPSPLAAAPLSIPPVGPRLELGLGTGGCRGFAFAHYFVVLLLGVAAVAVVSCAVRPVASLLIAPVRITALVPSRALASVVGGAEVLGVELGLASLACTPTSGRCFRIARWRSLLGWTGYHWLKTDSLSLWMRDCNITCPMVMDLLSRIVSIRYRCS